MADLEPAPDFGGRFDTPHILGMAKINGAVKTLLDIDRVLSADCVASLSRASGGAADEPTTLQPHEHL
jgi:purine-binding chemotaxis protein CheW